MAGSERYKIGNGLAQVPTKYKLYFVVSIPLFGCETCALHAVKECRKLASEAHVSTQARLSAKRLCFRANQR
ncbi:hypothetical protein DPMN_108597 [Dreissena polymorpha]|uniref:Uncharacterized protein n=1 Tax=Dreissena polymorpha TaxID=45954 RepID=A0A9D4K982_DREPO|nr:hypothetical protein DPMN_108597 [Dreissena polymorpha]